ncbi:hypothetical protein [Vreelandella stevensii]|uniref:hypothetical protein n=1 Tax=Vreelandella stevensii TaxID=502821 RepID=UPI0037486241
MILEIISKKITLLTIILNQKRKLAQAYFGTPAPSGPASLGRAYSFLVINHAGSACTVWFFLYMLPIDLSAETLNYIAGALLTPIFIAVSTGAGYLSARSNEPVARMNSIIFLCTGFFPHALITSIALMRTGYALWVTLAFLPCCLMGAQHAIRASRESEK